MDELKPCPWCGQKLLGQPQVSQGSTFRWRQVMGCCTAGPEVRHDTMADDQAAAELDSTRRAIEAWNTRAASGGDVAIKSDRSFTPNLEEPASLEQRARSQFEAQADPHAASWDRQWEPTKQHWRNQAAALANQQGLAADALRYAAYFRWLMRGKNLELAAALMDKDQYATLRRLCESLVPIDDVSTQPAGANQQGVGDSQAMQSFLDPVSRRAITVAVESAAHYGWSHASWDWESVKGGLDRFGVTQPAGDVGREAVSKSVARRLAVQRGVGDGRKACNRNCDCVGPCKMGIEG